MGAICLAFSSQQDKEKGEEYCADYLKKIKNYFFIGISCLKSVVKVFQRKNKNLACKPSVLQIQPLTLVPIQYNDSKQFVGVSYFSSF